MTEKSEVMARVSGSDHSQPASSTTSTVLLAAVPDAGTAAAAAAAGSDERGIKAAAGSDVVSLSPQVIAMGDAASVLAVSLPPEPAVQGTADNDADGRSKRTEAAGSKVEDAYERNEQDRLLHVAGEALARLYDTHDTWFGRDKQGRLEVQAREVTEALSRVGNVRGLSTRARVSYIRGRALDVFTKFNPDAEKCLAKAVKLHPSEPDGWTALGHCYWKKPDLFAAKRCFLTSLEKERKADTLRQLSMLLRQMPGTAEEKGAQLQESLRLAKEAVTLDIGCGDSWYVLGNGYVASFFGSSRGIKDLDRALQAYKKAEAHGGEKGNPDLFFNRAQVLHYREDYPESIRDFRLARELDPMLPVNQALHSIETGVERLAKLVEKKGGLKTKRLSQLIAPLRGDSLRRGLGDACSLVGLRELRLGRNMGVAVALKVVMPAGQSSQPPERLVVVDRSGECAVLSLYSISREACEKIQSKDTLVVRNPDFRTICLGTRPRASSSQLKTAGLSHDRPRNAVEAVSTLADTNGAGATGMNSGGSTDDGSVVADQSASSTKSLARAGAAPLPPRDANETTLNTDGVKKGGDSGQSRVATAAVASDDGQRRGLGGCTGRTSSGASAPTTAGAVVVPTVSYPCIQADPAQVLLNGETMAASFAPPAVSLAAFDK
ncbi:unnamed protein product [Ectocarpus fasciculatus]